MVFREGTTSIVFVKNSSSDIFCGNVYYLRSQKMSILQTACLNHYKFSLNVRASLCESVQFFEPFNGQIK